MVDLKLKAQLLAVDLIKWVIALLVIVAVCVVMAGVLFVGVPIIILVGLAFLLTHLARRISPFPTMS